MNLKDSKTGKGVELGGIKELGKQCNYNITPQKMTTNPASYNTLPQYNEKGVSKIEWAEWGQHLSQKTQGRFLQSQFSTSGLNPLATLSAKIFTLRLTTVAKLQLQNSNKYGWGATTTWGAVLKGPKVREDENPCRKAKMGLILKELRVTKWISNRRTLTP